MSLPVATTISGVNSIEVLDQNLQVAVNFKPLETAEMRTLRDQCRFLASDSRLELFKMTTKYDGKVGREQHHFPTVQELPLQRANRSGKVATQVSLYQSFFG
jgi:hypothetical protein